MPSRKLVRLFGVQAILFCSGSRFMNTLRRPFMISGSYRTLTTLKLTKSWTGKTKWLDLFRIVPEQSPKRAKSFDSSESGISSKQYNQSRSSIKASLPQDQFQNALLPSEREFCPVSTIYSRNFYNISWKEVSLTIRTWKIGWRQSTSRYMIQHELQINEKVIEKLTIYGDLGFLADNLCFAMQYCSIKTVALVGVIRDQARAVMMHSSYITNER